MAIYDNNWKSYALYVTATVESNADYGCIEKGAYAGIGLVQWTYDRSWQLLNLMATVYPETQSMFPILWDSIKPGTSSWGRKTFNQSEANEISAALVTDQGVATQDKLWNQDCDESYIPLLRDQCSLTDPWGAIFGLTVYHQSPQAFWQVYNACGNANKEVWYTTVLNNGIVGKYRNRQDTVKKLLDEWDGESGKEGFGTRTPTESEGGNFDPNNGNPDNTFDTTLSKVQIKALEKYGKQLVLHINVNSEDKRMIFWRTSEGLYYPIVTEQDVEGKTEDTPVPPSPPATGGSGLRQELVDRMVGLENKLAYSQAWDKRTNINGGYCDCSGLCWFIYNEKGISIGTWTGEQAGFGSKIVSGSGSIDESKLKLGDLILFNWSYHNPSFDHVEMYIGNGECMGHGGRTLYGPIRKNLADYTAAAYDWEARTYISD